MTDNKILIIDDEELVLKTLEQVFLSMGYTPFCTVDGNQALQLMKEHNIRVLFTDLRMPIMDGLEVCRRAKKIAAESHVYAISAYVAAYSPAEFEEAGFAGQFGKPFDTKALLNACKDAFAQLAADGGSLPSYPEDKRRTPRVNFKERMLISVVGSRRDTSLIGKTFLCENSSVSRGGLQLFAAQPVEPGTDLSIHIGIKGQTKQYVLDVIARWCQTPQGEEPTGARIPVGVELLPSSRDLDCWRTFVDELPLKS